MPSDISGTPVSRFFPSHLTAPHDTQHTQRQQKRQREMDTERGQRKSRGQLLRLCSPSQRKLRARHLTPLQLPVTLSLPPLLLLSLLSPQGVSPHRHLSDSSIPLAYPTPA
ncbi:hypothetical protein CSPX01_16944 [Colletotrichum filicis]|nr:hypothetical protein CSPX01_16944 [Colletotrichum filicis]